MDRYCWVDPGDRQCSAPRLQGEWSLNTHIVKIDGTASRSHWLQSDFVRPIAMRRISKGRVIVYVRPYHRVLEGADRLEIHRG